VRHADQARRFAGVAPVLDAAGLAEVPAARVAVFVGNAWDPRPGAETPWLDLARQLAGDAGVAALGPAAREAPPGTETLARLIAAAGGSVLLLFDEVLNFCNRHRPLAEPFYAFLHNVTVAMTGTTRSAAVVSLPRSQVEMTDWDLQWQERLTKVVQRVARELFANHEAEVSEVIRRRLFEDLGPERMRRRVAHAYADWCFARRAQLPPEWTAVDTAVTEACARDLLRERFAACYPFHPATLSVFQRKWQSLPQYQQTRGTLAMLAQWVALAYREGFQTARREPLITLGSAPLAAEEFRAVVLAQLGEPKLAAAIEADIAGPLSHARVLDADTKDALRDIHRRVGTAILFESSGGQVHKVAALPELRFALGEPAVDIASIDNAAAALEARAFYIRRVGSDGYQLSHRATLRKVVNDKRAALDEESEVAPRLRQLVQEEFRRGAALPLEWFPTSSDAIPDTPRLRLVVMPPEVEWTDAARQQVAAWIRARGAQTRQYPAALLVCLRRPGRTLRDRVALWLAWQRVAEDLAAGALGGDYGSADVAEVQARVREARAEACDEVWASYTVVVVADRGEPEGIRVLDLGAGPVGSGLTARVLGALKAEGLLAETVGAGYLERHWPPAFQADGAWPLVSLRQAFLDGSLIRLPDPEAVLRAKLPELVAKGELGLGAGRRPDGSFERVWYQEPLAPEEVVFEPGVYLLRQATAAALRTPVPSPSVSYKADGPDSQPLSGLEGPGGEDSEVREGASLAGAHADVAAASRRVPVRVIGAVPPEVWNRLGTRLVPKLREHDGLAVRVEFTCETEASRKPALLQELQTILQELGLSDLRIE